MKALKLLLAIGLVSLNAAAGPPLAPGDWVFPGGKPTSCTWYGVRPVRLSLEEVRQTSPNCQLKRDEKSWGLCSGDVVCGVELNGALVDDARAVRQGVVCRCEGARREAQDCVVAPRVDPCVTEAAFTQIREKLRAN